MCAVRYAAYAVYLMYALRVSCVSAVIAITMAFYCVIIRVGELT